MWSSQEGSGSAPFSWRMQPWATQRYCVVLCYPSHHWRKGLSSGMDCVKVYTSCLPAAVVLNQVLMCKLLVILAPLLEMFPDFCMYARFVCSLAPTLCYLCALLQVLEAAVVGIPHVKWSERPLLVVVPQPQYAPGEHD